MTSIAAEPPMPEAVPVDWRCTACGLVTPDPQLLTETLDPATKVGRCMGCKKPGCYFRGEPVKPPVKRPAEPTVAHARRSDPETSHAAAESITPAAMRAAHGQVLAALHDIGPMTDEELVAALTAVLGREVSPSGARTRRSELVEMGRVVDSGQTRPLRSGRAGVVWAVVPEP